MTDVNETEHPRAAAGTFTTKEQSAPDATLTAAALPADLIAHIQRITEGRENAARLERTYQVAVGDALEKRVLELYPTATTVEFRCGEESWSSVPQIEGVLAGDEYLWESNEGDPDGNQIQAIASLITSPFRDGFLLEQQDDPYGDYRNFNFVLGEWRSNI